MQKPPLDIRIARALDLVGDQGRPQDADGLPVRNAPSPLKVFVPFLKARGERRQRRLEACDTAAGESGAGLRLSADGHWHDAGPALQAGDKVRISASGRLFISRPLEVSIGPRTCLWYRIGNGEIARLKSGQATITALESGPLRLQAALPGAFDSPQGEVSTDNPPPPMKGELQIRVSPVDSGQAAAADTPAGWRYLWRLGEGSIFRSCDDGASLCCDTHGDVGILQHPVDLPLTADLKLDWDWLVEELPSSLPEHIQPTHDYLSIAVEFDNGLDLTWMWSSRLPAGTIFQCPLPWWDQRETHWVLRTPEDGLGRWISESRNLLEDYRQGIGGPLPQRVVGVWLIANSVFQSGQGRCRYKAIRFQSGTDTLNIHP